MKTSMFSGMLLAAIASGAASAETLKTVPPVLDPKKAYILVEYRLMANSMSDFPGSRKTLPLVSGMIFARYDPALADIRGMGKAQANPVPAKMQAVEPFRNREIVRGEASRLLLLEVEPDIWVIQGWGTTSFSLGSYTFRLEAGTVTDLGVASGEPDWAEGDRAANTGDLFKMALLGPFAKRPAMAPMRMTFRPRAASDIAVPATIPADKVRPVVFESGATFGNYLGGLVNRIEGVNKAAAVKEGGGD